ncbi:ATP-binding protein [Paenibacillus sp. sgz302251]|uniref:GAF domain-containing sensor histidine kinase n=1 Tax=Paenibacillus sp. sgz302251 TaxID=3414493 RepID=UPI003C7DDE9D
MLLSDNSKNDLLEELPAGYFIMDNLYHIRYANRLARSLIGTNKALPRWFIHLIQEELSNAQPSDTDIHFEARVQQPYSRFLDISVQLKADGIAVLFREISPGKEPEHSGFSFSEILSLNTDLANHIITNEEPRNILDSLLNDLSDYLELDLYFNYIFDKTTGMLQLMNYSGINEGTAKQIRYLEFGEAICGSAAKDQTKIIVEEIQQSVDPRAKLVKGLGIQAYACHPLFSYGRLIGTLSFGSSKRSRFTHLEVALMETICNLTAMTLERSILITELKNKNTELTLNNQMLWEKESKLRALFDGALDGMILIDDENTIVDANPAAYNRLGVSRENFISRNVYDFFDIVQLNKENREVTIQLKNGTERIYEYTATAEIIPGNKLIIFRDITSKNKITNALFEAKEQAEKANNAKSEFLSMMSHELRTPLNSILGYSQIMLDDKNNLLNDIQKERASKILKAGRHLIALINEILDHTQFESGTASLNLEIIELTDIIEETVRLMHPIAEAKGVIIESQTGSAFDFHVNGDTTRLKQVMINLLSNAIKYNRNGGKVTVHYQILHDQIKIFVDDTGIGMNPEELQQIFEPFYRIFHPEHNIEGTGIGLTLMKNFIAMMGGSVGVSSQKNEGSSFWFALPLVNTRM